MQQILKILTIGVVTFLVLGVIGYYPALTVAFTAIGITLTLLLFNE